MCVTETKIEKSLYNRIFSFLAGAAVAHILSFLDAFIRKYRKSFGKLNGKD
ncbi:MAG: hypothetical protein ACJA1B_002368 [Polaribacter sp.]|jgi:hypothetical protein